MLRNARPSLTAVIRRVSTPLTRALSESAHVPRASNPPPSATPTSPPFRPRKPAVIFQQNQKPSARASRHGSTSEKPLLTPYDLSIRLKKMCDGGQLDEAIEVLKNMPLDAQNTVVWNGIIHQAGQARRFQLLYQLYIEMKRRGIKPVARTYGTMMGAFAKVPSWSERTKLLQNVHKTYESYLEYLDMTKAHDPKSPELSVVPINAYLTVLSRAGQWQRIFDVYNSLDAHNLAPDKVTYTVILHALGIRSVSQRGDDEQAQAVRERAASDARFVWRQMMKFIENGGEIAIDSQLIDAAIQSLGLGRPADQVAAFDILRDYVGLAKPGETALPPRVELSPFLLSDVLWLCNVSKKYRLSIHFVQEVMQSKPEILHCGHMNHVLAAYGYLGAMGSVSEASRALQTLEWMLEQELTSDHGQKLRPILPTYTLVLGTCWRAKDWESAMRTFELMTGYLAKDFSDGSAVPGPLPTQRSDDRNILPNAAAISFLVRTAHSTGDHAAMRQCLRIVHHFGLRKCLAVADAADKEGRRNAPRFQKDASFYAFKAATAVADVVGVLVPKKTDHGPPLTEEQRVWTALRSEAKSYLIENRQSRPQETPSLEEQLLGSERGLAATDEAVAWDRMTREQKSSRAAYL